MSVALSTISEVSREGKYVAYWGRTRHHDWPDLAHPHGVTSIFIFQALACILESTFFSQVGVKNFIFKRARALTTKASNGI